jgi:N-acetylmuramoyl-L-alanine amidase
MVSRFTVTRAWTSNGTPHANLKGENGFVSVHGNATANATKGQEVFVNFVDATEKEVPPVFLLQTKRKIIVRQ